MSQIVIKLNLTSYWHIGSGEEGGSYADALVLKDRHGLPYVPGKSLKGLFRGAFEKASQANWFAEETVALLFGQEGEQGSSSQGVLQFSNACLSQSEIAFFTQPDIGASAKQQLYKVIQSTKINQNGVAEEGSFRAIEVAVPLALEAHISLNTQHDAYANALSLINNDLLDAFNKTSVFITALGAKRQRGYGAVEITVDVSKEVAA